MKLYTGDPFWLRRSGLIQSYPPLRRDVSADVLVVGAGISGALTAHALATAGADVVVVDGRDVASGSSAATSGLLLYDTDTSLAELARATDPATANRIYQLGLDAIEHIARFTETTDSPCGFARRSSLYLASGEADVAALAAEYEARRGLGYDVTWLRPHDVAARYSFSAPAAILAGHTAEVDCYRLTHALLADAARHGARVFDRTTVGRPTCANDGVTVQSMEGHTVRARRVVWATGYDAERMIRQRTGKLASTWVFVSEPLDSFDGWRDRCLIWETARPYLYLRSTDDGRLLAGGEDEPCAECHRSERWFQRKIARIHGRVQSMFPRIRIDIAYAWAGTFATTDDGLPFIGETKEWPGVWFALSYGGNGITFAAVAARIIRDCYLGVASEDAAIFAFDRARRPRRPRPSDAHTHPGDAYSTSSSI